MNSLCLPLELNLQVVRETPVSLDGTFVCALTFFPAPCAAVIIKLELEQLEFQVSRSMALSDKLSSYPACTEILYLVLLSYIAKTHEHTNLLPNKALLRRLFSNVLSDFFYCYSNCMLIYIIKPASLLTYRCARAEYRNLLVFYKKLCLIVCQS